MPVVAEQAAALSRVFFTVARRHQGLRPPPIPRCRRHGGTGRGRPSHVRLRTPADFLPWLWL